jgi:pSer/pThr/pTyr-binding forkhead associated (FHA) protein
MLSSSQASRTHFQLTVENGGVTATDLNSTNGTTLDGAAITSVALQSGQSLTVGGQVISITFEDVPAAGPLTRIIVDDPAPQDVGAMQDVPADAIVDINAVLQSGRAVSETLYCAVGAGLGSFVWVDHLRCYGAHPADIMAIGPDPKPHSTYQRYCANSQIPDHERLRSNSASTPDNIWGFPGYALRESASGVARLRLGEIKYVLQVFGEPTLAESYTPRAGHVFDSLDKEAARIGWNEMLHPGLVQAVRKTSDGRYAIYWRATPEAAQGGPRERVTLARVVHISTGYPATRFVDDFQDFLARQPDRRAQVANAYEPHEHIYQDIEASARPVNIMVRGRGIVASRILQRLSEARHKNPNITILHSIRSPIRSHEGAKWGWARRPARDHVELQPFNWPKASWGGDVRKQYERASAAERGAILAQLGGTSTAERSDWIAIAERGGEEGWYQPIFGNVTQIDVSGEKLQIGIKNLDGFDQSYDMDYLVDCTGLIADLQRSVFLNDLLTTYQLPQNHAYRQNNGGWEQGRATGFAVSNSFEIEGMRHGDGRVYAAGQVTAGGPYLAVDSFLGLQYAALRAVDDMTSNRVTQLRPIAPLKSFGQWLKWCTGARP